MANVFIQDSTMSAIGDAIRAKTGGTDKILPADMATEIAAIETGSDIQLIEGMEIALDFSAGDQSLTAQDGYAVKSATIKKPDNLKAENIKNGVDIAGVVGTLESGGGESGDSESGVLTLTAFDGLPSFDTSTTITGKIRITVPEEAIVEHTYVYITVIGAGTTVGSSTTLGTIRVGSPTTVATEASAAFNMKTVTLYEYSIDNPDELTVTARTTSNYALVRLPNVYIKDNILYAKANCKALLPNVGSTAVGEDGRRDSLYYEGVDLRGSQVERLPSGFGRGHSELKKLWLSENFYLSYQSGVFEHINGQLEELHFTATTPKPVSSSYVFSGLNTACKIYVPAGTLDAYTSTSYYPSSSTYTYIEE